MSSLFSKQYSALNFILFPFILMVLSIYFKQFKHQLLYILYLGLKLK